MKKLKDRGITLVALVITIIVLLILAGVSIAILTESGLFEKARLAEQESKDAQERENSILREYEEQIPNIEQNSIHQGTEEDPFLVGSVEDLIQIANEVN